LHGNLNHPFLVLLWAVLLLLLLLQMMRELLVEEPATLFVVGSYHIGKERAYLGAAQALGMQVGIQQRLDTVRSCPVLPAIPASILGWYGARH
jgi:hypothetical protein